LVAKKYKKSPNYVHAVLNIEGSTPFHKGSAFHCDR